jgi:ATP-dependent DNA helicase RecG
LNPASKNQFKSKLCYSKGISKGINEGINILFLYIKNNEGLQVSQLSEALKIPSKTLECWVSALKAENKIEFRGSKKTGGYFVVK